MRESVVGTALLMSAGMYAEQATVAGGKATFEPPPTLHPMSAQELARKYPASNAPKQAYAAENGAVSVAFDLTSQPLPPERLGEATTELPKVLSQTIPGIRWLTKESIRVQGQTWVHLEFLSDARDTQIHNHLLLTSLDGRMLLFNFNATTAKYEQYRSAFLKSRDSIRLIH